MARTHSSADFHDDDGLRKKARDCAELLSFSILAEAVSWPSPGLVSALDTGSHTDMDVYTFLRSGLAITPSLEAAVIAGMQGAAAPDQLFARLQQIGIQAEASMRSATSGVNTHKGTIFLGILLAGAAGGAWVLHGSFQAAQICAFASEVATPSLLAQVETAQHEPVANTVGLRALRELGWLGIRGEVLAGFPRLLGTGLPALREGLQRGNLREAIGHALLSLFTVTEDTTVLNRSFHPERLELTQRLASDALERGSLFTTAGRTAIERMHRELVKHSISPGGSADLVSMSLFLHLLETEGDTR